MGSETRKPQGDTEGSMRIDRAQIAQLQPLRAVLDPADLLVSSVNSVAD